MGQVVPINHKTRKTVFPTHWPTQNSDAVLQSLLRQQSPRKDHNIETHHFMMKPNLFGAVYSVIIQPNNSILFRSPKGGKRTSLDDTFAQWQQLNTGELRDLSAEGFAGTVVGKLSNRVTGPTFHVYYIVAGTDSILLDTGLIESTLRLRRGCFKNSVVVVEPSSEVRVTIDKTENTIHAPALSSCGDGTGHVGFPVTLIEPRLAQDGTPSESAEPRMYSTPVHFDFSAFEHKREFGRRYG